MLKRVLAILLSSVLLLGVVSCAKDSETAEDTTDTQTEAPFAEESDGDDKKEDKKEQTNKEPVGEPTTMQLNSSSKGIKILGERYVESESQINCDWTCSGIEFVIESNGGPISFKADSNKPCYFKAYVDGKELKSDEGEKYYEVSGQTEVQLGYVSSGKHTVRFIKVTGHTLATAQLYSMTYYGKVSETAPADNKMYIEFVGDSISCGWGVIGENGGEYSDQDGSLAYPYLLARALNADYSVTALSGQGVVSGGVCNMTKGYVRTSPLRDDTKMYGFERKADVVVVNIGTNDYTHRDKYSLTVDSYQEAYKYLLLTIKDKN